jgi:hypothetical protein
MFKAAFKYSALLLPSQAAFATICSNRLRRGCTVMLSERLGIGNNLCGAYSDDGMTLLELQTIYAGLEDVLRADWQQPTQLFEARLDAVHKLLSSTETYTFKPKFQVNPEATLIAQSLSRSPDLKTVHGSIQNALSLVIDKVAPMRRHSEKRFGLSERPACNCGRRGSAHIGDFRHAYSGFQTWDWKRGRGARVGGKKRA